MEVVKALGVFGSQPQYGSKTRILGLSLVCRVCLEWIGVLKTALPTRSGAF